jgi:hypothetical protein
VIGGAILGTIVVGTLLGVIPRDPPPAGLAVCNYLVELKIPALPKARFDKVDRRFHRVAFEVDDLAPDVDERALRSKARAFVRSVRESEAETTVELADTTGHSILELLDACDDAGFVRD